MQKDNYCQSYIVITFIYSFKSIVDHIKLSKTFKLILTFIDSKLSERFFDAETSERDPEFVKLLNTSNRIYGALSEGTLQQTKLLLPPHYTFHDKVSSLAVVYTFGNPRPIHESNLDLIEVPKSVEVCQMWYKCTR